MLDIAELQLIQSDAAQAACDQPCTIMRGTTRIPLPSGGAIETPTVIAPPPGQQLLVGMAQPSASQLQNFDYLIGPLAAWQLKFPIGTNVQEQDQVLIAGQTLNVVKVLNPRSYPALLTCLAVEVK